MIMGSVLDATGFFRRSTVCFVIRGNSGYYPPDNSARRTMSFPFGEKRMRVLGVDPGSLICGYGIVDEAPGGYRHVDCGGIAPHRKLPLEKRLDEIYRGLLRVIDEYRPNVAAVETIFFAVNVKSAITLGQARGVALLALAHSGVSVFEYSPTQIKKSIVGFGRAEKDQVAKMVASLLNLPEPAMADASDALAAGLCHLNSYKFLEMTGGFPG
jgi:crossover junction endodeoxyribonuclease RuvC